MSERTSYAPGTPCWVDLGSPDLDASVEFYGALFGWEVPASENVEQTGGYRRATKNGADVAGMMPLMQEGQPPAWSSYISVIDADATATAVKQAGGSVLAEPMDVMELGRMAVFADPTGAVFGIWQPGTFLGAGLVNEPGALAWNELNTRDLAAAKAFYGAVFGWDFEEMKMGETETYTTISLGGNPVGGILDMVERGVPDEIPAHWLAYFAVEDADATVAQANERGGGLMMGPIDLPVGRFAILTDPHGAAFAVIALSENAPPASA
ncbi:MAG TPA: VOC family protein [Solirubrobacterales bacterium]|jgi:predicted enzyme related to lactoylglutathione lyase|nr:VOC family protein [Solirubrobacterales bacterium]